VAKAIGQIPFKVCRDKANGEMETVKGSDLEKLLNRPNPYQSFSAFVCELATNYQWAGNAVVISNNATPVGQENSVKAPSELYNKSYLYIDLKVKKGGSLLYEIGKNNKKQYLVNPDEPAPLVHLKTNNAENDFVGISPFEHCAVWVDIHNRGAKWNNNTLANDGKIPMVIKAKEGNGELSKEQRARIKEYFTKSQMGYSNAGKPLYLGGLDIERLALSPEEMDFENLLQVAERIISSTFGVPFPLISPDAATFSNVSEAKEMLWTDTIIPLTDYIYGELNRFLEPYFDGLKIYPDYDEVPALEVIRMRKKQAILEMYKAGLISVNEARQELSYEPFKTKLADTVLVGGGLLPLEDIGIMNEEINNGEGT